MTNPYARIFAYGDLDQCRQALESLPVGLHAHVLDGRYCTFAGDTDLTPGLEALCDDRATWHYHAPPADALPFGHALDVPDAYRPGVHAKARWADRVLPGDRWSLKLDTDERLRAFDPDFDALERTKKYAVEIDLHGQAKRAVNISRLWVPDHWTAYTDDCLLPRALFPPDHLLEALQRVYRKPEWTALRFLRRGRVDGVDITNHGADRPAEYQRRRADHLKRIGRDDRWTEVKAEIEG